MKLSIRVLMVAFALAGFSANAADPTQPAEWICNIVSKGFGQSVGDPWCLQMNSQYAHCYQSVVEECFKNGTGETRTNFKTIDHGCKTILECGAL